MAKQTGLGDQLYVNGRNFSGDVAALDEIGGGPEYIEMTGIDKSAKERLGGHRSGRMNMTVYFNPAANSTHDKFGDLVTTDNILTYTRGQTLGCACAGINAKQLNYDGSRGDDGSLTYKVEALSNSYGLEWGESLTAGVGTFGGASAGSSIDYGAAVGTTAFGLQAYLHVFAFTGTSATVAIQSSTDDGGADPFSAVTGATFTAATGITSERIATATNASVERYLRVNVTGTFSLLWFHVMVVKNLATPTF